MGRFSLEHCDATFDTDAVKLVQHYTAAKPMSRALTVSRPTNAALDDEEKALGNHPALAVLSCGSHYQR
jgi:hypothetical protein